MTKAELIKSVAKTTGMTQKDAKVAVDATLNTIADELGNGKSVSLLGFGKFMVRDRAARTGRDPQTGKPIEIAAHKVPAFRAGTGLKCAVID